MEVLPPLLYAQGPFVSLYVHLHTPSCVVEDGYLSGSQLVEATYQVVLVRLALLIEPTP